MTLTIFNYPELGDVAKINLHDIVAVGPDKACGYLPSRTVEHYTNSALSTAMDEVRKHGLSCDVIHSKRIDWLVVWHEPTLQQLIADNRELLAKTDWPQDPASFAKRAVTDTDLGGLTDDADREKFQHLMDVIYANPKLKVIERPILTGDADTVRDKYWAARGQHSSVSLMNIPFEILPLTDVLQIVASNIHRYRTQTQGEDMLLPFLPYESTEEASLAPFIDRAADRANYTPEQINEMIKQLNKQGQSMFASDVTLWRPKITAPTFVVRQAADEPVRETATGPSRGGTTNPTLPQGEVTSG